MKRLTIIYICIITLALFSVPGISLAEVPANAREAAEQALDSYKQVLKGTEFDFLSEKEFQQAKVGNYMLPVYNFDITKLSKGTDSLANRY